MLGFKMLAATLTIFKRIVVIMVVAGVGLAQGAAAQANPTVVTQITDVEFVFWYDAATLVSTFGPVIQTHRLASPSLADDSTAPVWRTSYPATIFEADQCGTWLAASGDNEITLFDMAAGWQAARLEAHTGLMKALMFSPDCRRLVSTSTSGQLLIWDVATRAVLLESEAGYTNALFTPDGALMVVAASGEPLALWDMADPAQPRVIAEVDASGYPARTRYPLAISPDGRRVARVRVGAVEVLTLPDLQTVVTWPVYTGMAGAAMAFSPDSRWLAYSDRGTVTVVSSVDWEPVATLTGPGAALDINTLAFDPSGTMLLARHQDDRAVIWSMTELLD